MNEGEGEDSLLQYASTHPITDGNQHFNKAFQDELRAANYYEVEPGEWEWFSQPPVQVVSGTLLEVD